MSKSHNRKNAKKIYELLVIVIIILGLFFVVMSRITQSKELSGIFSGIGVSLIPAGLLSFLLSRFADSITEMFLSETVEQVIRERMEKNLGDIEQTVSKGLNKIDEDMKRFSPLFISSSKLGLQNIYLTRTEALKDFVVFLNQEIHKADIGDIARVWIVSSSIKGFLQVAAENFDGRALIEKIANANCDLRIMMTDPEVVELRSNQEGRGQGEIRSEVIMNLAYLKRLGVTRESIKFYSGTPTVFAIATKERMLLNPYPYQTEAFRCFSVVVNHTLYPNEDIYHQYLRHHFEEPWNKAKQLPKEEWEKM